MAPGTQLRRRAGHTWSMMTGPSQQLEVVAGPAAAVEQRQVAAAGYRLLEKWRHEAAEAAEPEVIAFSARRGLEQTIHAC